MHKECLQCWNFNIHLCEGSDDSDDLICGGFIPIPDDLDIEKE
jgi:hypothetical protein